MNPEQLTEQIQATQTQIHQLSAQVKIWDRLHGVTEGQLFYPEGRAGVLAAIVEQKRLDVSHLQEKKHELEGLYQVYKQTEQPAGSMA